MRINYRKDKMLVRIISRMNGILFCLFGFSYLYFLQGDLLRFKIENYLFSGKLVIPVWVWAVLITSALWGVQTVVKKIGYNTQWYAMTYLPSYLLLGYFTYYKDRYEISLVQWVMVGVILITLISFVYWNRSKTGTRKNSWEVIFFNLLQIVLYCFVCLGIGNTNDDLHRELTMKQALRKGNYLKVLSIGNKSLSASAEITSYRIQALLETGKAGDYLFEYPQYYPISDLQLQKPVDLKMKFNKDIITLLLDRELKSCYRKIIREGKLYYKDSLPRYYDEAVILYNHLYTDSTELDFVARNKDKFQVYLQDQKQIREELNGVSGTDIEKNRMRRKYSTTYWWYYQYGF